MSGAVAVRRETFSLAAWEGRLEAMRQQIIEAQTVQECLHLSNAAEAMLAVFKIGGASIDDQNRIASMKLDVERKAGEKLATGDRAGVGRPAKKKKPHDGAILNGNGKPTYRDLAAQLGVTVKAVKHTAERVQLIFIVPDPKYHAEKARMTRDRIVITSQHFIALGRKHKYREHRRKVAASIDAPHADVRLGDFRTSLGDLPDESVGLIFTDPPYDRGSIPLYGDLAALAARVLCDGGSLVCYAGQYAFPDIFPLMTPHLRYQWVFAVRHSGGHRRQHGWKIRAAWKPLLWFVKGRYAGDYLLDLLDSSPGEKSNHDWAQGCAEAAYLIEKLCPETGLVLDPMCGSGTALVAAKKLGRRFLGVEVDPERRLIASAAVQKDD